MLIYLRPIAFTPSDKARGEKCRINERIRLVDGATFYEIVTGQQDALKILHQTLPKVINTVLSGMTGTEVDMYSEEDMVSLKSYFDDAYGE